LPSAKKSLISTAVRIPVTLSLNCLPPHLEEYVNEEQKEEAKKSGMHVLHGLEDVVDVAAHGAAGAVKGVADGVESASAATKTRSADSPK